MFETPILLSALLAPAAMAGDLWPDLSGEPEGIDATVGRSDAALIVGIENYAFLPDIPGAGKNADDWERWMMHRGVPLPNLHVLVDRLNSGGDAVVATREEILNSARKAASAVGPEGTLWVVFIGHGAPALDKEDVLLLGADTSRSAAGFKARGLSRRELLDAMKSSAGATVAVLDTCFSGQGVAGESLIDEPLQPVLLTEIAEQPALELLATSREQFAGPLPGEHRPAFSYIMLGALRGWGDEAVGAKPDGVVTAEEALAYTKETLGMMIVGRVQEPSYKAPSASLLGLPLGVGSEKGPDRAKLRKIVREEANRLDITSRADREKLERNLRDEYKTIQDTMLGKQAWMETKRLVQRPEYQMLPDLRKLEQDLRRSPCPNEIRSTRRSISLAGLATAAVGTALVVSTSAMNQPAFERRTVEDYQDFRSGTLLPLYATGWALIPVGLGVAAGPVAVKPRYCTTGS